MTGSGKSTFLEQRVYGQRRKSRKAEDLSIIFIDPHGDSVSKLKKTDLAHEYFSRMVYVDAFLKKGFTPTINPLHVNGISIDNVEMHAQALSLVFEELIPDAKLSTYMRTILQPCLTTLLLSKHASLTDLQSMMTKSDNNRRVELGKYSQIPSHRAFFQNEFMSGRFDFTKNSLFTKLQSLLNSPTFYNWVD